MSQARLPRVIINDFALQFVRSLEQTALPPRLFEDRKVLLKALEETRISLFGFRDDQ